MVILAVLGDIKEFKIKNRLTLSFMCIGLFTNLILDGVKGFAWSLGGIIVPLIILVILYVLRMLGAGDLKLFSAVGSVLGLIPVLYVMVYSFFSGAIIAVIIIFIRKNGKDRFKYILRYLKQSFLTQSIGPYTDFNDKADRGKFRFALAILSGTIIYIIFDQIGINNIFL